jgi:benzodiazapine receptor
MVLNSPSIRSNWKSLLIFIVGCYLVSAFGAMFTPGEWYSTLRLAPWNPPPIAFPIVWSILYLFIALAGWQIFAQSDSRLNRLWLLQLLLNGIWSWIFFGQHWLSIALLDLLILDIVVLTLVLSCFKQRLKFAGLLLVPYLIWILVATSLNAYIVIMN